MSIEVYEISGRRERFTGALANVNDFCYNRGMNGMTDDTTIDDASPITTIGTEQFLHNPQFSLYCFDNTLTRAVFVELPAGIDFTQMPFVYQAQFDYALRVVTVPIETFVDLAHTLPAVLQPIFVYMSARSGSTLVNNALNASGVVASLSEPDAVTQLVHFRKQCAKPGTISCVTDETLSSLADSSLRFLFRQGEQVGGTPRLAQAVKPRSEGVRMMDLFQQTFPQAHNLFLYRDALGWVNSFHRIFTKLHHGERLAIDEWQALYESFLHTDLSHLRGYLPPKKTHLSLAEQLILWWIAIMEWYLEQKQQGMPVLAVRYDSLNRHKTATMQAIFDYCNLPPANVEPALGAFAEDSQVGTVAEREEADRGAKLSLDSIAIGEIVAILTRHPELYRPNYWAPGTLDVEEYLLSRTVLQPEAL